MITHTPTDVSWASFPKHPPHVRHWARYSCGSEHNRPYACFLSVYSMQGSVTKLWHERLHCSWWQRRSEEVKWPAQSPTLATNWLSRESILPPDDPALVISVLYCMFPMSGITHGKQRRQMRNRKCTGDAQDGRRPAWSWERMWREHCSPGAASGVSLSRDWKDKKRKERSGRVREGRFRRGDSVCLRNESGDSIVCRPDQGQCGWRRKQGVGVLMLRLWWPGKEFVLHPGSN